MYTRFTEPEEEARVILQSLTGTGLFNIIRPPGKGCRFEFHLTRKPGTVLFWLVLSPATRHRQFAPANH